MKTTVLNKVITHCHTLQGNVWKTKVFGLKYLNKLDASTKNINNSFHKHNFHVIMKIWYYENLEPVLVTVFPVFI